MILIINHKNSREKVIFLKMFQELFLDIKGDCERFLSKYL